MKSIYEKVLLKMFSYLGIPMLLAYGVVYALNLFYNIGLFLFIIFCALGFTLSLLYSMISTFYINLRITKKPVVFIILLHSLYILPWFFLPYNILISTDLHSAKNFVLLIIIIVLFGILPGTLLGFLMANESRINLQKQNQTVTLIQQPELQQDRLHESIDHEAPDLSKVLKKRPSTILRDEIKKLFEFKKYPPRMRILMILMLIMMFLTVIFVLLYSIHQNTVIFTRLFMTFISFTVFYLFYYGFFYTKPRYGNTTDQYVGIRDKIIGFSPRLQKYSAFVYGGLTIAVFCMGVLSFVMIWFPDFLHQFWPSTYLIWVVAGILGFFVYNVLFLNYHSMSNDRKSFKNQNITDG